MVAFNKIFSIEPHLIITIKRLLLNESVFENQKFLTIQNSAFFSFGNYIQENPLTLPKLYTALRYCTGPGDLQHDNYKGSYSFLFELEVQKNSNISEYLYSIYHYRSYIEFSVRQIVSKTNQQDTFFMHKPNDELFSDSDICYFSEYFCGYLLGFIEGAKYTPTPFVKGSESNFLLFGYYQDKYFFKKYENSEQYNKAKSKLEIKINSKESHKLPF